MKLRVLAGAVLLLLGGFILARGLSYTSRTNVVDLGQVRVSTDEKKPVPPWIGGVAALAGIVLVLSGGSRRS